MACYSPLHGFRAPGGQIKFNRSDGYADLPITVPCGQCVGCRLERSRQWAVRCMHEAQMHGRNCFVTLTFDDDHLPEDKSLDVKYWQTFAKSFRKLLLRTHPTSPQDRAFRFFHCGEYGDRNGRMHLHACIFGQDFAADRSLFKTTNYGDSLYESPTLTKLWPHGLHAIGALTFDSAAYVARYIMKKQLGECAWKRYGTTIDVLPGQAGTFHTSCRFTFTPEYTTMSRNPGIGKAWIDKYINEVYPADEVITNGHPARPPKFYDQQLEKADPTLFKKIKARRRQEGNKHLEDQTYERLAVKERTTMARMRQHTRDI